MQSGLRATSAFRRRRHALQHAGTFDGQVSKAKLLVVPGSGTGELSALRGEGSFEAGLGAEGERASHSTSTSDVGDDRS
jgi:hypothetical protein